MRVNDLFKTVFLVSLIVPSVLFAQGRMQPRTPEEKAQNQTRWMKNNLALTPEQANKAYDINLYYARETENEKNMPPSPDKKAQRQGIKRNKDQDLKAVLTGEQYQRYQQ